MRRELVTVDGTSRTHHIPTGSSWRALLGLRGVIGQHTADEDAALAQLSADRRSVVEIGVAEGVSARTLRAAMARDGTLTLIDPYPAGFSGVSLTRLLARLHVGTRGAPRVRWVRSYSYLAVRNWSDPIDFLLIDGNHSYDACLADFLSWSSYLIVGGRIAFHDARVFPGSWTTPETGSVRVVNEFVRDSQGPWRVVSEVDSLVVAERWAGSR